MSTPPSDALTPVDSLGTSTGTLFSRLYQALRGRRTSKAMLVQQQKQQLIAERNERMRRVLQQREAEVKRLNGILATIDEGIIMQDTEGRIVLINEAAQGLLGNQKNFWESELGTLFDSYRDVTRLDTELAPLGEPTRLQVNNRILGVQLAAVAGQDGERLGTMIVLRDVTRDAVADHLKDQFVTAISHELRTPMTVIKGASEVLAGQPADQPTNRKLLETLTRNVDILDRMVVEMLDISEMGAGTFAVRDHDVYLEPMLWSIINSMEAEFKRARLEVFVILRDTANLVIEGDEQRLRWAIGHLFQNSIRYTERDGRVIIATRQDTEDPNMMTIEVMDNGVGIAEKDLAHVFERFYRGEPRTRDGRLLDPRGLGQGLFIARTVANAHGGYLTVQSQPGDGTIFRMGLPISRTEDGEPKALIG